MGWQTFLLTLVAGSTWAAVQVLVSDTSETHTLANPLMLDSTYFSTFTQSWTWFLSFWIKLEALSPPGTAFMSFETAGFTDMPYTTNDQVVSNLFGTCNGIAGVNTDWLHFTYFCDGSNMHLVISKRDASTCNLMGTRIEFKPDTAILMIPTTYLSPTAVTVSIMDVRFDPVTTITLADVSLLTCLTPGLSACPCDTTCATCASYDAHGCTTCKSTASISSVATVGACTCPGAYYPNPDSTNCSVCDSSCGGCTGPGPSDCSKCKGFATLSGGVCTCSDPYVLDPVTDVCQQCYPGCTSCIGPGPNDCTKCSSATLSSSPGPCTCATDFVMSTTGDCCPSSCPETCFSTVGCFLSGAKTMAETAAGMSLPYLSQTRSLICFRSPIPKDCALSSLEAITSPLNADPSTWALSLEQCMQHLDSVYPTIEAAYNKLFKSVPLPAPVTAQEATTMSTVQTFFKLWVIQFNYLEISKKPEWVSFRTFLNSITDWTKVAAYNSPPKYWDGKNQQTFPQALQDWIAGGGTDYEVLNIANGVSATCKSAACDATAGATCCAAIITRIGPCCQAHSP